MASSKANTSVANQPSTVLRALHVGLFAYHDPHSNNMCCYTSRFCKTRNDNHTKDKAYKMKAFLPFPFIKKFLNFKVTSNICIVLNYTLDIYIDP